MSKNDKAFFVIFEVKGRMRPCKCGHETAESAMDCVREKNGVSVMEWVRERNPQFQEYWRSPKAAEPS